MQLRSIKSMLSLLVMAAGPSVAQQTVKTPPLNATLASAPRIKSNYGKLPLVFEANQGQTDPQVRFLFRGNRYTAFLTSGSMVLTLRPTKVMSTAIGNTAPLSNSTAPAASVEFQLAGAAKNPAVVGEGPLSTRVNYFIGNDRSKWHTNIPTYQQVRYQNVYPGIDLVYYGNHRRLEYDFVVSAHADPSQIDLRIKGAKSVHLDPENNLILETGSGELHFQSPVVYQQIRGQRVPVQGSFAVKDSSHITFLLSQYDRNQPLVIDPVLEYGTYIGGSGDDQASGIAVDGTGSVYVAGYTDSTDFPAATLGSLPSGTTHVFVAKLDATGSNLVYADYIGGNSQDYGYALALDGSNHVYVTGSTASSDFPTVNAYQGTYPGSFNAFLTEISAEGSSLLYSTYLGGDGSDIPTGVAIDNTGDMFVAGNTTSDNFPVVNAYQSTISANQGGIVGNYGFLTKFTSGGSSLAYSTYLSGNSNVPYDCGGTPCWSSPYSAINGIAVDGGGNAYVTGTTNTYNFPTTNGAYLTADSTQQNGNVGFLSKFNGSGGLDFSTYFYESSGLGTLMNAIAVDASGSAYVTGTAFSDGTFPITTTSICDPGIYGAACGLAFITKFDPTGTTLAYSTFLGPNNYGRTVAIALDANNDAYVAASTSSNSFGVVNGIEPYSNGSDVLLTEIDPVASSELLATYVGGSGDDSPAGLALDSNGNIYVAGSTNSTDLPTTSGAFQDTPGGNTDAFVFKIGPASAPSVALSPSSLQYSTQPVGASSEPQTALLRNMGSSPLSIASIGASGDFAESDNCGTSVPAAGSCTLSVIFAPIAAGVRSGSIVLQDDAAGSPHTVTLEGIGSGPGVALSPAGVSFSAIAVGTSSAPQTVTLSNSGNITLNISSIQVVGDYSPTNNCPAALAASSSCTISVTFAPTATGARNGSLTINDDAIGSPQTATLTGSGADFGLASSLGSVTVKAGVTAVYSLTVSPLGGAFNGTIKLSCSSGSPALTGCSLSPTSITPGGNPSAVSLSISTTASVAQSGQGPFGQSRPIYAFWFALPGLGLFGLILGGSRSTLKKPRLVILLFLAIAASVVMSGCAGGTGITKPRQTGTTPGTYTITVTATSGALQHSLPLTLIVQ
jgi:hypothetical protein